MYIRNLEIKNLKLIRDLKINFSRGGEPRMWTVLVGRNGLCKTSILQAIALAASGPTRANQLADPPSMRDRRKPSEVVQWVASFEFGRLNAGFRAYPDVKPSEQRPEGLASYFNVPSHYHIVQGISFYQSKYFDVTVSEGRVFFLDMPLTGKFEHDQNNLFNPEFVNAMKTLGKNWYYNPLESARAEGLPHWFVAGYGVSRSLPFPNDTKSLDDPVRERLESLFGKGRITGTGFSDLLEKKLALDYSKTLKEALIGHAGMLPGIRDFELRGKGGVRTAKDLIESHLFEMDVGKGKVKVPATWLSHGYQATISWVADLIGQMFWETGKAVKLAEMEGLVLIDEIDLHLHPLWQVGLISTLKAAFPRVQFVATTHSPMMLTGLEADEIIVLDQDDEGNIKVIESNQSPKLMTGSELYGSFFGIDKLYPTEVGEALQRYGYLASSPYRSDEEEAEMNEAIATLKREGVEPGWEPTPRNGKQAKPKASTPKRSKRKKSS